MLYLNIMLCITVRTDGHTHGLTDGRRACALRMLYTGVSSGPGRPGTCLRAGEDVLTQGKPRQAKASQRQAKGKQIVGSVGIEKVVIPFVILSNFTFSSQCHGRSKNTMGS